MWEEKIYKRNLQVSPIGGIRIACFLHNGVGVLTNQRILPHYTLVYVTRGFGSYRDSNGVDAKVTSGDAILVLPGVEHWYGPPRDESWDEFYLVFEGPVFDMWRVSGCFDPNNPVVSLNPQDFWRDRILSVISGGQAKDEDELLREAIRVQELLADIQKASHRDVEREIRWLEDAKSALGNSTDAWAAAAQLHENYEAFRKKFRRLAGISPKKFQTSLVMEQACEMLEREGILMRDIADELGFCDEYHFSRQFSKTIGWSPSEYRARTRLKPADNEILKK